MAKIQEDQKGWRTLLVWSGPNYGCFLKSSSDDSLTNSDLQKLIFLCQKIEWEFHCSAVYNRE